MSSSPLKTVAQSGEEMLVAEIGLASQIAQDTSVAPGDQLPRSEKPEKSTSAGARAARQRVGIDTALPEPIGKQNKSSRFVSVLWVILAIASTLILCAWLANGLFERQSRLADAQRLGVYRDLQASRVIEYFEVQAETVRFLARQPIPGLAQTEALTLFQPGALPVDGSWPQYGEIAAQAGLSALAVVESVSGRIVWASDSTLAGRLGDYLTESAPEDEALIVAIRGAAKSSAGISESAQLTAQFVTLQPFSAPVLGQEAANSVVSAWYSAPLSDGENRYVLLAQTRFDRLLEHIQQTAVDPSPFTNEAPQTRVLVGREHSGLDGALLRESLRTPAKIMAVTAEQSAEPTLAAVRRLDISGNPMTLAILQGRLPARQLLEPLLVPLLIGIGLIALICGALAARSSGYAANLPGRLTKTIKALRSGDYSARTGLRGRQDHAGLGEALDLVLDDRAAAINRATKESVELNASVVRITETVGTIATTRDLSIRVPVTEDVTGTISDALNMLTDETGRALSQVNQVAEEVARATLAVKTQGELAERHVRKEREEVLFAVQEVGNAADAIGEATRQAAAAEQEARRADASSLEVSHKVRATANGVMKARELIRQTEKRVKRLGEHSQEIGQVVGIIESISERTGILALNTSLQAAAAGDAGRQFAGLADEVKRLSKSAGQATAQIGRMVSAIQTETAETVGAVSGAIMQIVEISGHVAQADEAMGATRSEIEAVVRRIEALSASVSEQAGLSRELQDRAARITAANDETLLELQAQVSETNQLVDCARTLIKEVGAFKTGHPQ